VYVRAKRAHHKAKFSLPLAALAGFGPLAYNLWQDSKMGSVAPQQMLSDVIASLTGWDIGTGTWRPQHLLRGAVPIIGGMAIHKMAGRFGVNRMLARAGIPVIRI